MGSCQAAICIHGCRSPLSVLCGDPFIMVTIELSRQAPHVHLSVILVSSSALVLRFGVHLCRSHLVEKGSPFLTFFAARPLYSISSSVAFMMTFSPHKMGCKLEILCQSVDSTRIHHVSKDALHCSSVSSEEQESALQLAMSPQPSSKLYCGFLPTIHQSQNNSDWNKVLSFHPKMLKA